MINTRSNERQTHCDIYALIHTQILDRDQTLVMILGNYDIELSLSGIHEHGVARPRAAGIDAFRLRLLNRGLDDRLIFAAKHAMLTGVRKIG